MAQETTKPDTGPRQTGRGWRILLVASLALNLLVAGVFLGAWVAGGGPGAHPRGHDRDRLHGGPSRAFVQALAPDEKRGLHRDMRAAMRDRGFGPRPALPEPGVVRDVLTAEPFAPEAVDSLLGGGERLGAEALETGRRLLVARIAGMSPAERAAYAERVVEELGRRGDRSR